MKEYLGGKGRQKRRKIEENNVIKVCDEGGGRESIVKKVDGEEALEDRGSGGKGGRVGW